MNPSRLNPFAPVFVPAAEGEDGHHVAHAVVLPPSPAVMTAVATAGGNGHFAAAAPYAVQYYGIPATPLLYPENRAVMYAPYGNFGYNPTTTFVTNQQAASISTPYNFAGINPTPVVTHQTAAAAISAPFPFAGIHPSPVVTHHPAAAISASFPFAGIHPSPVVTHHPAATISAPFRHYQITRPLFVSEAEAAAVSEAFGFTPDPVSAPYASIGMLPIFPSQAPAPPHIPVSTPDELGAYASVLAYNSLFSGEDTAPYDPATFAGHLAAYEDPYDYPTFDAPHHPALLGGDHSPVGLVAPPWSSSVHAALAPASSALLLGASPSALASASTSGDSHHSTQPIKYAKPGEYKTVPCMHWARRGTCEAGDRCTYAHGDDELRPVLFPNRYRTEICRFGNACTFGARCFFLHLD